MRRDAASAASTETPDRYLKTVIITSLQQAKGIADFDFYHHAVQISTNDA
jgi:hypothetical protein